MKPKPLTPKSKFLPPPSPKGGKFVHTVTFKIGHNNDEVYKIIRETPIIISIDDNANKHT